LTDRTIHQWYPFWDHNFIIGENAS